MKRLQTLLALCFCALLAGCLATSPTKPSEAVVLDHCSTPLGTVQLAPPVAASASTGKQVQASMSMLKKMIRESGCFVPAEDYSAERSHLQQAQLLVADFTLQPKFILVPATRDGKAVARMAGSDPQDVVASITLSDNRSGTSIQGTGRSTDVGSLRTVFGQAEGFHVDAFANALNQTVQEVRAFKAAEAHASGAMLGALSGGAGSSKDGVLAAAAVGALVSSFSGVAPAGKRAPARHVNLDAPIAVRPAQVFSVQVWLSQRKQTPEARTAAPAGQSLTPSGQLVLSVPTDRSEWTIKVALIAPGFEFANDSPNQATITLAAEDSNPALFELKATAGDPGPRTLRATLWHEGAFLGSVTREIEVRPAVEEKKRTPVSDSALSTTLNPTGLEPLQSDTFAAKTSKTTRELPSKPARGADLTVWIAHDDPNRLSPAFVVVASPHMPDPAQQRWPIPDDADEWLQAWADRLQRATATNASLATIRGLGTELYERLAPPELRRVMAELGPAVSTMQVYTNNAAIPWELMRPGLVGDRELDFLGTSLRLARWPSSLSGRVRERPPQLLLVRELVVMAPDYSGEERLTSQRDEVAFLSSLKGYRSAPGTFAGIQGLATSPPAGIVHFAGHGETTGASAAQRRYQLKLADGPLDSVAWRGLTRPKYATPSLFFFNACELGSVETQVGAAAGWAPAVLDSGAAGYIGGLWPLRDGPAAHFAKQFYADITKAAPGAKRMGVAEALRQARNLFYATGDTTYLAYVFYGDVNLELEMP